jgi:hypothetical protein
MGGVGAGHVPEAARKNSRSCAQSFGGLSRLSRIRRCRIFVVGEWPCSRGPDHASGPARYGPVGREPLRLRERALRDGLVASDVDRQHLEVVLLRGERRHELRRDRHAELDGGDGDLERADDDLIASDVDRFGREARRWTGHRVPADDERIRRTQDGGDVRGPSRNRVSERRGADDLLVVDRPANQPVFPCRELLQQLLERDVAEVRLAPSKNSSVRPSSR